MHTYVKREDKYIFVRLPFLIGVMETSKIIILFYFVFTLIKR